MKQNNFYNSKLFKFFDFCFRIVIMNLLVVVPSFLIFYLMYSIFKNNMETATYLKEFLYMAACIAPPFIIWVFPSVCASVNLLVKYQLKLTDSIFKEFFKSLKENYVTSLLASIIIFIAVCLMLFSSSFFLHGMNEGMGVIYYIGFILSISFSVMLVAISVHFPLVLSYMENVGLVNSFKLAGMMAFKDLIITLCVVIVDAFIIALSIHYYYVGVIIGISLPLLILVKLTFKKYYIVYIRTHKEEV